LNIVTDNNYLYYSLRYSNIINLYKTSLEGEFITEFNYTPRYGIDIVDTYLYFIQDSFLFIVDTKTNKLLKQLVLFRFDLEETPWIKVDKEKIYFTLGSRIYHVNIQQKLSIFKIVKHSSDFTGLAVDEYYLYVCDYRNNSVNVRDKHNGNLIRQWGEQKLVEKQALQRKDAFVNPYSILLHNDFLYVGDRYRIRVFTKQGNFSQYIGTSTTDPHQEQCNGQGEFRIVFGMCVVNGRLYVSDSSNNRIQIFI